MPTVRTPRNHPQSSSITAEHIRKFARLCEVSSIRLDCIRRKIRCRSHQRGRVLCAECNESRELTRELVKHFQLPAVVFSIYEPPDEELSAADKFSYWQECLEEAITEAREEARSP